MCEMGISEMKSAAGACQVVTRDLRRQPLSMTHVAVYNKQRNPNAYYPDFAYRVDVKRKCLQVLSVVGPSKCVQGQQIESASCFNRLQKEGDALCIEEYGKRLGYVYSSASSTFFTAIFECNFGEDVKWVNPLPFDTGAEDLVMSLARHASHWIAFFQRNISKLHSTNSDHTRLSLVLQLDMINCETWKHASKMPLEVRFNAGDYSSQGAQKKQKGVRYRHDRGKWVAEFNPPGKKNNKISLGEYDNPNEAARAADAGMFCYGSKRGSYNFDDSPRYLQQAPRPVSDDKEAIRKWARDFARITSSKQSESSLPLPLTSSASSFSDGGSSRGLTYESNDVSNMLQHSNSSISVSNIPASFASSYVEFNPSMLEYNSDSSSALSFSLEDVADIFSSRDISSREMPVSIEDFEQGVDMPAMPAQINSSPPPQEPISFPDDNLFRNDGLDQFWSSSPSVQQNGSNPTVRDSRTVTDDLFQCLMACYPGSSSPGSIQLISR